jgi:hypothetical protein
MFGVDLGKTLMTDMGVRPSSSNKFPVIPFKYYVVVVYENDATCDDQGASHDSEGDPGGARD